MNKRALTQLSILTWSLVVVGALLASIGISGFLGDVGWSQNIWPSVMSAVIGVSTLFTGLIIGAISLHARARSTE